MKLEKQLGARPWGACRNGKGLEFYSKHGGKSLKV